MSNNTKFPWYDGFWLRHYYEAIDIITKHAPEKLPEFIKQTDRFKTRQDYEVQEVKDILDADTLAQTRELISKIKSAELEKHEIMSFGRLVVHDLPFFDALQKKLCPLISKLVGEEVEPAYNFLSLYSNIGVCPLHMDTPEAKWTVDICIDQSFEWPIQFGPVQEWPSGDAVYEEGWEEEMLADPNIPFTSHVLQPGNAIIFAGSSQFHYRDRIFRGNKDDFCNLVFLHYVPKGTLDLVYTSNWAEIFGVPELNVLEQPNND